MYSRFLTGLATVYLCLMTYGSAWAANALSVWVALSDSGGVHAEAAEALRAELERTRPGSVTWRIGHWSEFGSSTPEPQWVVAIGVTAQRGMQQLFVGDPSPPPLLAILVPRLAFERIADKKRLRARSLSAVFLDQPPARQLELIRLAVPSARKVGVLVGYESKDHIGALDHAAKERDMQLVVSPVGPAGLSPALQSLFPDADVLLALPDPAVFNSGTAANILMAAYRQRAPLIGFSPAYTKAGALLSLHSTPTQIGKRGGEVLRSALANNFLPPPGWPNEFIVSINRDVARSLGVALDQSQLSEQLWRTEQP